MKIIINGGDRPSELRGSNLPLGDVGSFRANLGVNGSDLPLTQSDANGVCIGSDLPIRIPIKSMLENSKFTSLKAYPLHCYRPWMRNYQSDLTNYITTDYRYPLFRSEAIKHGIDCDEYRQDRPLFFVDLFFQRRFVKMEKDRDRYAILSPKVLLAAWNSFIDNFNDDPYSWLSGFQKMKDKFLKHSIEGMKMKIHMTCISEKIPCAIFRNQKCPMCYADIMRLHELEDNETNEVIYHRSKELCSLIESFQSRWKKWNEKQSHKIDNQDSDDSDSVEVFNEMRFQVLTQTNMKMHARMTSMTNDISMLRSELKQLRNEFHKSEMDSHNSKRKK